MNHIELKNIHKTYPNGKKVIKGIDLTIEHGELMVFVGPSGCGKSTLLRMIAGLEAISEGELWMNGCLVNDHDPVARGGAMVFQNYALYPHMTVARNMGFALEVAGQSKTMIRETVAQTAEKLNITHLLSSYPKALSGGERQRVAIGRAMVRKPKFFLFDEPLSNLDAALRVQLRIELLRMHEALGTTMIYVTHDQVEAMTMGTRIALFRGGFLEQVGRPNTLYHQPNNTFVAGFLGMPTMNLLPIQQHTFTWLNVKQTAIHTIGIRPEDVKVTESHTECINDHQHLEATVMLIEHLGDQTIIHAQLHLDAPLMTAKIHQHYPFLKKGDAIRMQFPLSKVHFFDASGQVLANLGESS